MLANVPPVLYVLVAFLAILAVYVVLRLQGTEAGVLDELALLLGGAVAGVASPINNRRP